MRDPLYRVSVRYKLAMMFVGLSLIAYGLGGFLVARSAEGALETEILTRLDFQCRAYATALDSSLRLLIRRAEDFASDGLIRDHATRLQDPAQAVDRERLASELRSHLTRNKLPLVEAFANLAVASPAAQVLVAVHDDRARRLDEVAPALPRDPQHTWTSGVVSPGGGDGGPGLVLATPLRSLDGTSVVGRLLVLVRAEDWVDASLVVAADDEWSVDDSLTAEVILHDRQGQQLHTSLGDIGRSGPLRMVADGSPAEEDHRPYAPMRGTFSRAFPISTSGWSVEVTLDVVEALRPVSGLRSRFVGVGAVLALFSSLLLFFPMRFLARPLGRLTRAAERLREGELETRVEVESDDEIGELGRAFNAMADAIQERTLRLEDVAVELRSRQNELQAGRDRLQAVISSMQDGLMVLDAQEQVIISNAAARPLLDLLEKGGLAHSHHLCTDGASNGDCFRCLFDPTGPQRSCLVDVGPRTFEIHTTTLPPDGQRGRGRVLVSREITDRIQRDEREIHNERLAVLGEVAAVMAHEINNPLASISMFNQMLGAELAEDSPLRENTEVIRRSTETAKRAIRELLDYATGATPEVGPLDIHDTLEDVVRFLRPLSERAGVEVRLEREATRSEVTGDEVQLRQVFVNLAMNAIQAVAGRSLTPGAGEGRSTGAGAEGAAGVVTLSTRNEDERLIVDVVDTGPGIDPADRERIFRPFFTTKTRGEGTGLGLPTTQRLTEMHGGSLMLVESSPAGTVFRVKLRARTPHGATLS